MCTGSRFHRYVPPVHVHIYTCTCSSISDFVNEVLYCINRYKELCSDIVKENGEGETADYTN